MGLYNRRLLLLDNIPASTVSPPPVTEITTTNNASSPSQSMATSSSTLPSSLPPRPVLDANVAYTMLVLLTALFFLGFISNYIRSFSEDSTTLVSSQRRRRRPSSPLAWNHYSTSACCGGVDPATIKSLPVFEYHSDVKQQQQQLELDCAICLSEFQEGEALKVIPHCEHVFHPECIDKWFASHVTCPVCRSTLFLQMKGQDEGGSGTVDKRGDEGQGVCVSVSSHQQGLTVENRVTWKHDGEVGSYTEPRTGRCSNSGGGRLMLRRTMSI